MNSNFENGYVTCEPNLENFTKSLLNIGYNHYTAILDIIDNSIAAGSTKVWIKYVIKGANTSILISDNGVGMEDATLFSAMRIASADPTLLRSNKNDLGKFGLGLKLASFSLSDQFQVVTKIHLGTFSSYEWDLNVVRKNNQWLLKKCNEVKWPADIQRPSGTDVLIKNLRTPIDNPIEVMDRLRYYLSTVYFMKKGITFILDDKEVIPFDIFFQDHKASNSTELETFIHNGIQIATRSFQIPHRDKLDVPNKHLLDGIHSIGMEDGIYLFRKYRLIAWSGWEGLGTNKRIGDLQRFAIYIDEKADNLFNIEVKKSQISILDDTLRRKLQSQIHIFSRTASRPYKKRAQLSLFDVADLWQIEKENDVIHFSINRKSEIFKRADRYEMKISEFVNIIEGTLPMDSLLYYLNTDRIDMVKTKEKKLQSAKVLYDLGLLTGHQLNELTAKYGK